MYIELAEISNEATLAKLEEWANDPSVLLKGVP
jgi:hypothetical protein